MTSVEIDVGMYALLWTSIALVFFTVVVLFIALRWVWNTAFFYCMAFAVLVALGAATWSIIWFSA